MPRDLPITTEERAIQTSSLQTVVNHHYSTISDNFYVPTPSSNQEIINLPTCIESSQDNGHYNKTKHDKLCLKDTNEISTTSPTGYSTLVRAHEISSAECSALNNEIPSTGGSYNTLIRSTDTSGYSILGPHDRPTVVGGYSTLGPHDKPTAQYNKPSTAYSTLGAPVEYSTLNKSTPVGGEYSTLADVSIVGYSTLKRDTHQVQADI